MRAPIRGLLIVAKRIKNSHAKAAASKIPIRVAWHLRD
jgi:hypothetical protein